MLDAINSITLASPVLRTAADATSTSDSFAANPDRVQKAATQSYVSPYYEIDTETQALVYEVRDTSTGKALLKISSPLSQSSSDTVSTYDSSAQIRTASQILGKSTDTGVQAPAQSDDAATAGTSSQSNSAQKTEAFANASANAAQAGNPNAGTTTFDEIV